MPAPSALIELPGDRLYPEPCQITPFTYGDAAAISLLPKTQDTEKLINLMDKRLNLDVKTLTPQDFWFTLYWQRINSYSTFPVKLPWECPQCDTNNIDELTGGSLVINDIDPEYKHGMRLDFPNAGPLKFRLKLVGDEILVKRYMRQQGLLGSDDEGEIFEELMTACMLEMNGGTLAERYELVSNMSADDHYLLKAMEKEFDYGVQSYSNFICEGCKEVTKVKYTFDLVSFFPSLQDQSDVRARILPSEASAPASSSPGRDGSDEDNLHQGAASEAPQGAQGSSESSQSPSQGEKISLTPEELQAMIQQGMAGVQQTETEVPSKLNDIVGNR